MKYKFIVTIETDKKVTSKMISDALNYRIESLDEMLDDIVIAKVRKLEKYVIKRKK